MVVQHNMQAANANRMLNVTTSAQSKSTEKLSSGYRINRAADDAAGLSISEKMRKQIKGLDRASTNAEDGVSAVQTAEGALTEVHSMLQRMNELATQSANGTNSNTDRKAIQDEIDQLTTEIDRVSETTKFNETYLLKGDGTEKAHNINAHDAGLTGAWFPGQECGDAIADVISGKANPSGKLPMTFPIDYFDIPSSRNFPMVGETKSGKNFDYTNYEEDIWVGYRYFNTANKAIVYPFGYGLSYTNFSFGKPKLERKNEKWVATIQITNTGNLSGKETVQLYISAPQTSIQKPSVELKTFGKTRELKPGESETVKLEFTDYDLASFDEANSQWLTSKGEYTLSFGASSKDFRATLPLNISKNRTWKVNNVLRPVEKINVMKFPLK